MRATARAVPRNAPTHSPAVLIVAARSAARSRRPDAPPRRRRARPSRRTRTRGRPRTPERHRGARARRAGTRGPRGARGTRCARTPPAPPARAARGGGPTRGGEQTARRERAEQHEQARVIAALVDVTGEPFESSRYRPPLERDRRRRRGGGGGGERRALRDERRLRAGHHAREHGREAGRERDRGERVRQHARAERGVRRERSPAGFHEPRRGGGGAYEGCEYRHRCARDARDDAPRGDIASERQRACRDAGPERERVARGHAIRRARGERPRQGKQAEGGARVHARSRVGRGGPRAERVRRECPRAEPDERERLRRVRLAKRPGCEERDEGDDGRLGNPRRRVAPDGATPRGHARLGLVDVVSERVQHSVLEKRMTDAPIQTRYILYACLLYAVFSARFLAAICAWITAMRA